MCDEMFAIVNEETKKMKVTKEPRKSVRRPLESVDC